MPITPRTYRGMRDHLPEAMRLRNYITDTIIGVLERYGFEPMATPIIEYADTIEGKVGDEEKLLFRLQFGDSALALRYDQTVSLARVVSQYESKITLPFKRYALGQSFRGERPARGRYREFWQLDVDIVGVDSPIADAEIVAVVIESLQALGFAGARTLLNHREILGGMARVAGVDGETAAGVYRAIDKLDKIGLDGVRDELARYGVEPAASEKILQFVSLEGDTAELLDRLAELLASDELASAAVANLRQVVANLEGMGLDPAKYAVAPALARGLSYYTGVVVEAVLDEPPMGSLLGGGRYDNLIGMFSKRSLPTVGIAFGLERMHDVMEELGMGPKPDRLVGAYVTVFSDELVSESMRLAGELRQAGVSTLAAYAPGKLGAQFKEADRKGAALALVIGPDDLAAGAVQLKDLRSGEQRAVPRGEIVAAVRQALA